MDVSRENTTSSTYNLQVYLEKETPFTGGFHGILEFLSK